MIHRTHNATATLGLCIIAALAPACQSDGNPARRPSDAAPQANRPGTGDARPLAYVDGRALTVGDLLVDLIEASGGAVLADRVLDLALADRLRAQGISLTQADVDRERDLLGRTLSDDPNEAARLLNALRESRGLGDRRFDALLRRNAVLRALVADQAQVDPAVVQQLHALRHGPRARVRLLIADFAAEAEALRTRVAAGEPMGELAATHSTDDSAATGGLLSPISTADLTYPAALRRAINALQPGDLSDLVPLDGGFAFVQLVEHLPGDGTPLADVEPALRDLARRDDERRLMQELARRLVARADLVPLDPAVRDAWADYRRRADLD